MEGTLETSLRSYPSILDNWALFTDYCSYLTGPRTRVKILFTFLIRQFFNLAFHSHLKRKEWEIQLNWPIRIGIKMKTNINSIFVNTVYIECNDMYCYSTKIFLFLIRWNPDSYSYKGHKTSQVNAELHVQMYKRLQ